VRGLGVKNIINQNGHFVITMVITVPMGKEK
jgi:hypothetical protein